MKCATIMLAILAGGVGLRAAQLWFFASRVQPIPMWAELNTMEPLDHVQAQSHWIGGLLKASTESSELNKRAALWTAWAVGLGALGSIAGAWPIWSCWSN
jgi:hypothetical protein